MHHFFSHPVPSFKDVEFGGVVVFIFRLANGSQYDPNYNSRVRVITFLFDLILSTYRSYRHRSQVQRYIHVQDIGCRRETTQGTFSKSDTGRSKFSYGDRGSHLFSEGDILRKIIPNSDTITRYFSIGDT